MRVLPPAPNLQCVVGEFARNCFPAFDYSVLPLPLLPRCYSHLNQNSEDLDPESYSDWQQEQGSYVERDFGRIVVAVNELETGILADLERVLLDWPVD